jgi:hypothetical protein
MNSTFMDENFNKLYVSEQRQGSLFTIFACIAIFIACLGLLGLSSFAITQRIKEIGIRKVLGSKCRKSRYVIVKRFFKTGDHCGPYRLPYRMVCHAPMALRFCLQDLNQLVDLYRSRDNRCSYCFINRKCTGHQSSHGESCEKFKNRVALF